jgi:hypothetical protein
MSETNAARTGFNHPAPRFIGYAIANFAGLTLHFLFVANICRQVRLDHSHYYDAGDGLKYAATGFPVLLACLLLNVFWGIKAWRNGSRIKNNRAWIALGMVGFLWAVNVWGCWYLANVAIKR